MAALSSATAAFFSLWIARRLSMDRLQANRTRCWIQAGFWADNGRPMFNWLMRGKLSKVADSDMAKARLTLRTMKLKTLSEGPQATSAYATGVRKVAALLSQRFELSVRDVLLGRGLDWVQLDDASDDLVVAANRAGSMLACDTPAVRVAAQGYSFGCLLLHHLYRLRFLSERAPMHQRAAADQLANHYAQFARSMADTFVGSHGHAQPTAGAHTKSAAAA